MIHRNQIVMIHIHIIDAINIIIIIINIINITHIILIRI